MRSAISARRMEAVRNRGYRVANGRASRSLQERIREALSRGVRDKVRSVDVAWSIASTNTELVGDRIRREGRE